MDLKSPPTPPPAQQGVTNGHPGSSWFNFLNRIPEQDQIFWAFWIAVAALALALIGFSSNASS